MKITLSEIEDATFLFCNYFREQGVVEFELPQLYWDVRSESRLDLSKSLTLEDLGCGDLHFDLENLRTMLESPDECLGWGLVLLGQILRTIGEQHPV